MGTLGHSVVSLTDGTWLRGFYLFVGMILFYVTLLATTKISVSIMVILYPSSFFLFLFLISS